MKTFHLLSQSLKRFLILKPLLKFTPWNQLLRLSRLSPAFSVTKLLQNCNYQSSAIPPGPALWKKETLSIPPGGSALSALPYAPCLPRAMLALWNAKPIPLGWSLLHWGSLLPALCAMFTPCNAEPIARGPSAPCAMLRRYFYLICPSVFSARNSVLTFPNFFNTLPSVLAKPDAVTTRCLPRAVLAPCNAKPIALGS